MLEMRGITKSYLGVRALNEVDLTLARGEVLALLGENGAGKSTLIKILGGAISAESGEIYLDGQSVGSLTPSQSAELGIAVIYQEFNLLPNRTIRENLFLGISKHRRGWIRHSEEKQLAREVLQELDCHVDCELLCGQVGVATQQIVEIGKALLRQARILIMDEPTAMLSATETECLLKLIKSLQERGIGIIYVTHRLDEVAKIASRVQILRDGQSVITTNAQEISRAQIVRNMAGRPLEQEFPKRESSVGEILLSVKGLRREPSVREVSFDLRRGELVALTGLIGSGRTEVARLLFGADRPTHGKIQMRGRDISLRTPKDAIQEGIVLLTEDRKQQGLVLGLSNLENFAIPNLSGFSNRGWFSLQRCLERYEYFRNRLRLRSSSPAQQSKLLSGGNQQKLVLAKWLQRGADLFIFDEPTRGIDVGARYEVYEIMNELLYEGKSLLVISSELPEVLGIADRILVMREGTIVKEVSRDASLSQEQLLGYAIGAAS